MEHFAKTINGFYLLLIFATGSILDAWQSFEYVSAPDMMVSPEILTVVILAFIKPLINVKYLEA